MITPTLGVLVVALLLRIGYRKMLEDTCPRCGPTHVRRRVKHLSSRFIDFVRIDLVKDDDECEKCGQLLTTETHEIADLNATMAQVMPTSFGPY